ncbi:ketohexokinase-like [Bacillus rossius redtenbacheri]|uniref:ketohexokinase-like n=1 Tax=Bacillus rossius redtenbacheri TaxID=93214 RepID=UPI002FDDEBD7
MTILCVGVACLDIIHLCDSYPVEDSKNRSSEVCIRRGGNASNSCTVLSMLGAPCEFLGTIGCKNARFMVDDFAEHGISLEHAVIHEDLESYMATLIINISTGSRTALYCPRDVPELSFGEFCRVDLARYSWVHFEGRNTDEVARMMEHAVRWNSSHGQSLKISIELEIPSNSVNLLAMSPMADCVFVGKDFAISNGWGDMHKTLEAMTRYTKPGATVVVPWGELGAAGRGVGGAVVVTPAFPPPRVVDTVGAGDTFIAATIFGLGSGRSLHDSIALGCRVAGAKVGAYGMAHLRPVCRQLSDQCR